MKNLFLIVLLCSCRCLIAQTLSPIALENVKTDALLNSRKPAKLTIQINHLPDSVKKVNVKYTLVQIAGSYQTSKDTVTDAVGTVEIILDQNVPYQQVWLSAGKYLYAGLYVNTGLTITIDALKVPKDGEFMIGNGVTYSGPDGRLNTVMNKKVLFKRKETSDIMSNVRTLCQMRKQCTPNQFTSKTDSLLNLLKLIDKAFVAAYPNYRWAIDNETLSDFYGSICTAYWNDSMPEEILNRVNAHQPYFVSNDGVLYYKYLSIYHLSNKRDNKENSLPSRIKLFDSLYTRQRADILKLTLLEPEKDRSAQSYPVIVNSISTKWCKRLAIGELNKADASRRRVKDILASSTKLKDTTIGIPLMQLAFNANLYQFNETMNADDLVRNLRAKFPGKVLIIDFWATWCGPCLEDLPYSKSVHEKNKDLPVEYIYLCTARSSSADLWKSKIAEMQIPGTHIYVADKTIVKIMTLFNTAGSYPAYVVIGMDGKTDAAKITRMNGLDRDSLKKIIGL